MLTPLRSLERSFESGRSLPEVPELAAIYKRGLTLRHGQIIMVAGRSGTQKSGFALWLCEQLQLSTLYFSADMSPFTASARLASMATAKTTEEIEAAMADWDETERKRIERALESSQFTFSFGSPIKMRQIDEELEAFVEANDCYPQVLVFDNLMDCEGAESDYGTQMEWMSDITTLGRETEALCLVLHHASDKTWDAKSDPWSPPSRAEIKGGMAEKPEVTLGVALDPHSLDYRIAILKQRSGFNDPTGKTFDVLSAEPKYTRFHATRMGRVP